LLLLLPVDFFSPPWLLRLLLEPLLDALALSSLPAEDEAEEPLPLLPADLLEDEDDFELPDFMVDISLVWSWPAPFARPPGHSRQALACVCRLRQRLVVGDG
jgi:hypothetical protein